MGTGEFGMELRVFPPWANYVREKCGRVATSGLTGTKYLYYFSNQHKIDSSVSRNGQTLPKGNPFNSQTAHMKDIPTARWSPPPYAEFFKRPEMENILKGKPLVVILNKYTKEWDHLPSNYFSVPTLKSMLDYLTPNYTVLYKRNTPSALRDHQGLERDLKEKDMIRNNYPDVLLFEDFTEALVDPEDYNLLFFGFMSLSKKFLSVQGGTAVAGSYFGGTNIILIKEGTELRSGDYSYFHKFSNATVIHTETDGTFLEEMKKNMKI